MMHRGQTMIELLIAMFVIVVGLTASGTIVFSNQQAEERSADRVLATNLAREGVEWARNVRDSNWLAGLAFDTGLYSGTDYTGIPVMSTTGTFKGFAFTPNALSDSSYTTLYTSTSTGNPAYYIQGTGGPQGVASIFKRLVWLSPICSDYSTRGSGSSCSGAVTKIGIHVTSTVQWVRRDGTHTSTVEDDMYDWR